MTDQFDEALHEYQTPILGQPVFNTATRDELAEKYAEPYRCPPGTEVKYCMHDVLCAFKAGWDAAMTNFRAQEYTARIDCLEIENKRLREALERIAKCYEGEMPHKPTYEASIAREALKVEGQR